MTDAWVDGSFRNNTAGWAFVVLEDGEYLCEEYGTDVPPEFLSHRNVAGEIFAVLKLLDFCGENDIGAVNIHHDYTGLQAWAEGTFKSNTVLTKYYKNYVASSGVRVTWFKTESHTGEVWNEYADKLAKYAIGALDKVPALPGDTEERAAVRRETGGDPENGGPIDIYSLKHVDLRSMLENKQKEKTAGNKKTDKEAGKETAKEAGKDTPPEAAIPQPVQDIPQMSYELPPENGTTPAEAFGSAEALAKEERFMEAWQLLKPFMNNTLSDDRVAFYLKCMTGASPELARKACSTAEKCLLMRHDSRAIQKELVRALFKGFIEPCLVAPALTSEDYENGRRACIKLLEISSTSPSVMDKVLPFMRVAFCAGDRAFLSSIKTRVDPGVLSDKPVRLGGGLYSKRREFLFLTGAL